MNSKLTEKEDTKGYQRLFKPQGEGRKGTDQATHSGPFFYSDVGVA